MKNVLIILTVLLSALSFGQVRPIRTDLIGIDTLTTTERNLIPSDNGKLQLIYNSTDSELQQRKPGGVWESFGSGDGTVTGNETAFDNWDKNASDDLNLSGTNVWTGTNSFIAETTLVNKLLPTAIDFIRPTTTNLVNVDFLNDNRFSISPTNTATEISYEWSRDYWAIDESPIITAANAVENGIGGKVIEPQSTNLITYSEDFSANIWTKVRSTILVDEIIAPNGLKTADKLVENTENLDHRLIINANGSKSFFFYLKKGGRSKVQIYNNLAGGDNDSRINLEDGTVTAIRGEPCITEYAGNGWWKVYRNGIINSTGNTIIVDLVNELNNKIYQGDGTSGIYIWGAQAEALSFSTSYIPTAGSTVTRLMTDDQALSLSGTTLTLEDGGTPIDLNSIFATDAELSAASVGGSGTGNVVGPASSTDESLAVFDNTTGKLLKSSDITLDQFGNLVLGTSSSKNISGIGELGFYNNNRRIFQDVGSSSITTSAGNLALMVRDFGVEIEISGADAYIMNGTYDDPLDVATKSNVDAAIANAGSLTDSGQGFHVINHTDADDTVISYNNSNVTQSGAATGKAVHNNHRGNHIIDLDGVTILNSIGWIRNRGDSTRIKRTGTDKWIFYDSIMDASDGAVIKNNDMLGFARTADEGGNKVFEIYHSEYSIYTEAPPAPTFPPTGSVVTNGEPTSATGWVFLNGSGYTTDKFTVIGLGNIGFSPANWVVSQENILAIDGTTYTVTFEARRITGSANLQAGEGYSTSFNSATTTEWAEYTFTTAGNTNSESANLVFGSLSGTTHEIRLISAVAN